MKKTVIYFLLCMVSLSLAGCDSDEMKAIVLDGTWTGYLENYHPDRWGNGGKRYHTAIQFVQETMTRGTGREVDYDMSSPYNDYYYSEFTWVISNGIITIHYNNGWNTVTIRDYKLNLATFRGTWIEGNREIYFDFSPTSNFDWSRYRY